MNVFWKHVTSVFAGTLLAQSIPIVGSLAITRIYAPSEFGDFASWLAVVSFLSVAFSLRFEAALQIIADVQSRREAVYFIFVTVLLLTIILLAFLIFIHVFLVDSNILPGGPISYLLLVPAVFLTTINNVLQTWAAADGDFTKLNTIRVFQALVTVFFQISAGLNFPTAISLICAFTFANVISFVFSTITKPWYPNRFAINLNNLRKFYSRYRRFPTYALPADCINTAVAQLPLLVVFQRFGSEPAGYLALTMRVMGIPVIIVGKSVLDVFKRHAMLQITQLGNCRKLYTNTFKILFLASLLMVFCTILFAEIIFRVAFGVEWIESGKIAVWLLPMFALGLIASPLSYISYLVEKQHIDMIWQAVLLLVALCTLYSFSSYRLTLIGYGFAYATMYIIYIYISFKLSEGV